MDKEILNSDGSRIYQANILLDNVKRLEQENEQLKKEVETWNYQADKRAELSNIWFNTAETYKQALQEIRDIATLFHSVNENKDLDRFKNNILDKINEVIGAE